MSYKVGLDEALLATVTKRFLETKKTAPEELKYYKVVDGVDYYVTTFGSAGGFKLINKYDRRNGETKYVKPLPKGKKEEVLELEGFPDVESLFLGTDEYYQDIVFDAEDIKKMIAIHDLYTKTKPFNRMYGTAVMELADGKMYFSLHDSEITLDWHTEISAVPVEMKYHYDFELMLSIWKGFSDFKTEKVTMKVKDTNSPIYFYSKNTDYHYWFAINRKLVK